MSKQEALEAIDGALVFVSDEVGEEVGDDASQVYRSLADVKAFIEALPE